MAKRDYNPGLRNVQAAQQMRERQWWMERRKVTGEPAPPKVPKDWGNHLPPAARD